MADWIRLTPDDAARQVRVYFPSVLGYHIAEALQRNGKLEKVFCDSILITPSELSALPPVKARDERIARLERVAETARTLIDRLAEVNSNTTHAFALQAALDYGSEVARVVESLVMVSE